jgi:hypothetical protein
MGFTMNGCIGKVQKISFLRFSSPSVPNILPTSKSSVAALSSRIGKIISRQALVWIALKKSSLNSMMM